MAVRLFVGLVGLMSLSGCISVICPDGKPVLDAMGQVLKVTSENERVATVEKNCSPKQSSIQNPPTEILQLPPAPTPTNLAPAVGGLVIAGAAFGLGGGDNNQPVEMPPAPPVTNTTGTR